ncbi:hypothetical protein C8R47DRAFT_1077551 [Mycena vitilis]|nr:hypothetical protein C8R47DRAFT_1077551 [Mycena vitilis]
MSEKPQIGWNGFTRLGGFHWRSGFERVGTGFKPLESSKAIWMLGRDWHGLQVAKGLAFSFCCTALMEVEDDQYTPCNVFKGDKNWVPGAPFANRPTSSSGLQDGAGVGSNTSTRLEVLAVGSIFDAAVKRRLRRLNLWDAAPAQWDAARLLEDAVLVIVDAAYILSCNSVMIKSSSVELKPDPWSLDDPNLL